ncbi:vesicle-associated protein 2-1-like [Rutidosis leptorrhynchoides]|uniref:vesicle-associated protein 2-1-like n=1 Tax=Rutidosis leptorrhynchoides TaxID=125765 RepID=UPI003A99B59F
MASGGKLVSVDPEELRFQFELEKPSHCDLKVSNTTDKNVAFKVKTTSPKKYFVRPNTGVIQPYDSCTIRVTLQAQLEYPPDMQCRDKFLLQSTPVPPNSEDLLELPANTFSKEPGKQLEEYKLKVVYIARTTDRGSSDDSLKQTPDLSSNQAIQTARAAKDAAVKEATQLQQELDTLKRRNQKKSPGISIKLAIAAGLIGIMVGFILKMALASPLSTLPPSPPPTAE